MKVPSIQWYQTDKKVIMIINTSNVINCSNFAMNVKDSGKLLEFNMDEYEFNIQLTYPVSISSSINNGRNVKCILEKLEKNVWNTLTNDNKFNKTHVSIDWNNWIDLEDNDETADIDDTGNPNEMNVEYLNEMMKKMGPMKDD